MPRLRKYIDTDVVTEAKKRLAHVYDMFDNVVLMFSGGKDSSAVLELMRQYQEEHDLGPVEAIFSDEEVLPYSNIAFLEEIRHEPWLNLHWQCYKRIDERYILGSFRSHVRWDENDHELMRPIPEWAETLADFGLSTDLIVGPDSGVNMDDLNASRYKGSVAFLTGIRASESLVRYRSVVNKLNENYICRIEGNARSQVRLAKVIYDWEENDVLKFLKESNFPLCSFYDAQELAGSSLRIGPPLGGASKRIGLLKEMEPEFYEQILASYPDMAVQERYWHEFDMPALVAQYSGDGFNGVLRYIRDHVPEGPGKKRAIKRYRMYRAMHDNRPDEFPPEHLLKQMMAGARDRKVRGIDVRAKANQKKVKK